MPFQIMLFTRNMQIQNGVLCLEPIYSKKSNVTEAYFVPCNFSKQQRWSYTKITEPGEKGKIVHQASGRCLSFSKKKDTAPDTKYGRAKMLAFLSDVVSEIAFNIDTPIIEHCEQDRGSKHYNSQVWAMDSAIKFDEL